MTEEQFDEWIKKLEDPETEAKKGKYTLKDKKGNMCCLGVLACINNIPNTLPKDYVDYKFEFPDDPVPEERTDLPTSNWMGISGSLAGDIASTNDNSDTFKPVIEYLKNNKEKLID
tara:strand:- start:639 stop:986 length:348 start_codon:yes stop_codon:yes gene_type:complete